MERFLWITPDAARLGHGDGETGFGHRVHGGGNQRDAEFDGLGEAGARIDLAGKDFGGGRHQQHIVESERFADAQVVCPSEGVYEPGGFNSGLLIPQVKAVPKHSTRLFGSLDSFDDQLFSGLGPDPFAHIRPFVFFEVFVVAEEMRDLIAQDDR